jgi:hypothetical protein
MGRLLRIGIGAAAFGPLLALGLYALHMRGHGISENPEDWARFGEYVGGALGAFYGFLAFLGVLITIKIQQSQSELEELQRLMCIVSERADHILSTEPKLLQPEFRERLEPVGAANSYAIMVAMGVELVKGRSGNDPVRFKQVIEEGRKTVGGAAFLLEIELTQLVELLNKFMAAGGTDVVRNFYYLRYGSTVAWMDIAGLLQSDHRNGFFEVSQHTEDFRKKFGPSRAPGTY